MIPGIGPRFVDEEMTDVIDLVVGFDPKKADYDFVLTSTGAPPLPVRVHIENLRAIHAFQKDVTAAVYDSVLAAAKRPGGELTDADSLVKIASGVMAEKFDEKDPARTLLLAARFFDSVHWQGQALLALREAEKMQPQIANDPSIQQFGAYAAYFSGEPRVFSGVPSDPQTILSATHAELPSISGWGFVMPELRNRTVALAAMFKQVPNLAPLGHSLEGDLAYSSGDFASATLSYNAANELKPTPSFALRLGATLLKQQDVNGAQVAFDRNLKQFPGTYSYDVKAEAIRDTLIEWH